MAVKIERATNAAATAWQDITGSVVRDWHFGGRAANGESEQSGFNLEDDAAGFTILAHRVIRVTETATTPDRQIFWGRVESVDIGRGKIFTGDARQFDVQLSDANAELRGITTSKWVRPAESPYARMRAFLSSFCDGSWRPSTVLDRTTHTPGSGFVNMPKKTYLGAKGDEITGDVAATHGLLFFVTNDLKVYTHLPTDTSYASTISISDVPADINGTTVFGPSEIPVSNALEGDQVLSGGKIAYGANHLVAIRRSAVEAAYDRWEDVISSTSDRKDLATDQLNGMLDKHGVSEDTVKVALQLRADQVDLISWGMTLSVLHLAAAGITTTRTMRIGSLVWSLLGPDLYLATLELGFPRKFSGSVDHSPVPPSTVPQQDPFQPGAEGGFTYIQSAKTPDGTAAGDATLGAAPTAGNFLVAVTEPDQPGGAVIDWELLLPDGWAIDIHNDIDGLGRAIASKVSDGSETLTEVDWYDVFPVSPNGFLIVEEYDVGDAVPVLAQSVPAVLQDVGVGSTTLPAITPTAGSTALIVWLVGFHPNYAPTVSAGWNIRQSYDTTGGSRLRLLLVDRVITNASGSYSGTLTSPGGTDNTGWVLMAAVYEFEPDGPAVGQPVAPESATSNGVKTVYRTAYPYRPGSLVVEVNGVATVVAETDPTTGLFTLPAAPALGALITWTYIATEDNVPTGATNPSPTPDPATIPTDPGQIRGGDGVYRLLQQQYVPAETPDGSRTVFTIVPYLPGATFTFINGLIQRKGIDWNELSPAAGTIEFTSPPWVGAAIEVTAMPV